MSTKKFHKRCLQKGPQKSVNKKCPQKCKTKWHRQTGVHRDLETESAMCANPIQWKGNKLLQWGRKTSQDWYYSDNLYNKNKVRSPLDDQSGRCRMRLSHNTLLLLITQYKQYGRFYRAGVAAVFYTNTVFFVTTAFTQNTVITHYSM